MRMADSLQYFEIIPTTFFDRGLNYHNVRGGGGVGMAV